jgi:hypothetical protein
MMLIPAVFALLVTLSQVLSTAAQLGGSDARNTVAENIFLTRIILMRTPNIHQVSPLMIHYLATLPHHTLP